MANKVGSKTVRVQIRAGTGVRPNSASIKKGTDLRDAAG